jgi:adenylate cyclase class 2
MLEVEVKAPCRDLEEKLVELGAQRAGMENHEDVYFNPPWRDFRESDEALRIRRVNGRYLLTYKGPRIDSETKTREEIEIPTKPGIMEILDKLGFKEVGIVRKSRRIFKLRKFIVCLDRVEGLGEFIEVEAKEYEEKDRLFEFLEELGIDRRNSTTKSYLELLEGRG